MLLQLLLKQRIADHTFVWVSYPVYRADFLVEKVLDFILASSMLLLEVMDLFLDFLYVIGFKAMHFVPQVIYIAHELIVVYGQNLLVGVFDVNLGEQELILVGAQLNKGIIAPDPLILVHVTVVLYTSYLVLSEEVLDTSDFIKIEVLFVEALAVG